ncbi:MAG: DUF6178 family protein [Pseudomonadota bacterium]
MKTQNSISKISSNQELKKDILSVSGDKAFEMILDSPTPTALVQSFSEEDIYWLVQDLDPENALSILSMASNEQWRYIVDLQVWDRDRLNMDSVHSWFGRLLSADTERFLNWGLREESEVLYLYLFRNIEVRIKEEDQTSSDFEDTFFTLDDVFYIRILDERYQEFLKNFLSRLAEYNFELYQRILLNLGGILPDALEEEGYRFRSTRLAEKGFLPFEEAIGIYQYLDSQAIARKECRAIKEAEPSSPVPALTYSLPLLQEDNLFAAYLKEIGNADTLERLQTELAGLCNQILSADVQSFDDREVLRQSIQKAGGYLTIGLETLTKGDRAYGVQVLAKYPLNRIFRIGYGRVLEHKWRVEKWLKHAWFQGTGLDLSFWDESWERLLKGLLKKRPLFYAGLVEREYREFQSMDDITHCTTILDQIEILDRLFDNLFANGLPPKEGVQDDLTWKSLLLTLWGRHELGLPLVMGPVTLEELKTFFRNLGMAGGKMAPLKEEIKTSFTDWVVRGSKLEIVTLNRLANIFESLFDELESEYRSVRTDDLDPRFIRLFWLS